MTVNRFCSSGLQTIAIAAQRVMTGEGDIFAAGGVESISCVQNEMNKHMLNDDWILANKPELYWPMLQTAEYVAKTYGISREQQDQYGVRSQQRAAAARDAGKFNDEIAPMTTTMKVVDKATGAESIKDGDGRAGRRHPRRHDLRGRGEDQAGDRGRRDLGRQRQPVLRRRRRLRRDEREDGGEPGA